MCSKLTRRMIRSLILIALCLIGLSLEDDSDKKTCDEKLSTASRACETQLHLQMHKSEPLFGHLSIPDYKLKTRRNCCNFAEYKYCLDVDTNNECREHVDTFMSKKSDEMIYKFKSLCQEYDYHSDQCIWEVEPKKLVSLIVNTIGLIITIAVISFIIVGIIVLIRRKPQ